MSDRADPGPFSTVAVISYFLLANFSGVGFGIFWLIAHEIKVADVMVGILGGIITAVVTGIGAVGGFWLASSVGAGANSAAIRQLAGAGAPPPAEPGAGVAAEAILPAAGPKP